MSVCVDDDVLRAIAKGFNGIASADRIAARLGYKPARNGRLAVSSKLRVAIRAGFAGRIAPEDQWGHADYFLTVEGKRRIEGDNP